MRALHRGGRGRRILGGQPEARDRRLPAGVPDVALADRGDSHRRDAGWTVDLGPMGTPEGDATALTDPSGTAIALLQVDRPDAMDAAYANEANTHAVR